MGETVNLNKHQRIMHDILDMYDIEHYSLTAMSNLKTESNFKKVLWCLESRFEHHLKECSTNLVFLSIKYI